MNVLSGQTYRFRILHAGSRNILRVSVASHDVSVVASDGIEIEPTQAKAIFLSPGERYDFILTANQAVDKYLITTHIPGVRYIYFIFEIHPSLF